MPPKPSPRQKALDKQEQLEQERDKKSKAELEKQEASSWAVGSKSNAKAQQEEEKELLKRQKAAELAALIAADEASLSTIVKKPAPKKKGKDDFDMLNAALANQPKTKAQKDAEEKKKVAEERKKKEAEARAAKEEAKKAEDAYAKMAAAKGVVLNHTDDLFIPINNHLDEDDYETLTGLDAAVGGLTAALQGKASIEEHPERRQKALYNAYYAAQLPLIKEEHPGLRLSQYKELIFENWKKSPENPVNQQPK